MPQLPGKYYLSDLPRLPPVPDNKERAAKAATGHLAQQMPIAPIGREAPRPETPSSPRQPASHLVETLDDKLEGESKPNTALPAPARRSRCRANTSSWMSAIGRGLTADIPFVKTKNALA